MSQIFHSKFFQELMEQSDQYKNNTSSADSNALRHYMEVKAEDLCINQEALKLFNKRTDFSNELLHIVVDTSQNNSSSELSTYIDSYNI